jgi:hypothetical protein
MTPKTYTRSFAGGELSPQLFGRLDLAKFQTGLAKCLNYLVTPQGPIQNRPGTEFVRAVKNSAKRTRLIPFTYSTDQTMVIEVGEFYLRFHTQGATLLSGGVPYEVVTPYAEADLFDLHYVQSADVLTITHPGYAPRELRRLGPTSWSLTTINFGAPISAPTPVDIVSEDYTTPKYRYQYVVTAVASDGIGESAASTSRWPVAVTGVTSANPGVITTNVPHGLRPGDPVTLQDIGGMPTLTGAYEVNTTPAADTLTIKSGGTPVDTTALGPYTSGGYVLAPFVFSNLLEMGCINTIRWNLVAGASRYNVYKLQGGLYGYISQTTGLSIVDDNIAPDLSKTPPTFETVFAAPGEYPWAVSYYEQRRCFGGSTAKPQNIWLTRSGTEQNMSYSIPTQDDDAITARIVAREANSVRHLVPLNDLLALTSGGVWKISSANSDVLTPASTSAKPQSYVGASGVQPVVTSRSVLYAQDRGGHVREVAYKWETQAYEAEDISVLANHLFDYRTVVQMAYATAPVPTLWAVRNDGILLGLTHVPEHEVKAWHQHDTRGLFESVTAVAEGDEDAVYVVVKRTIAGLAVRFVERLHSRQFEALEDAFFVDCGLSYDGPAVTNITGLAHLEGEEVAILADGGVEPPQTVTGGAITLTAAASKVHVGLAYNSDAQLMPLSYEAAGFGTGAPKNVNNIWLRLHRSSSIHAGPSFSKLRPYVQRSVTVPYGSPPELVTDVVQIALDPTWQQDGNVCIRQSDPLPLQISSISLEASTGG